MLCKECHKEFTPESREEADRCTCDACIVWLAGNEIQQIAEGFGGNYEEACAWMGW
jgi:transposase-like protein